MAKDPKKKEKKEQKNNFVKEIRMELKKVTWPTRKELVTSTGTVLLITLIIVAIVFVLDFTFEKLNTYGVEKLKSVVNSTVSEKVESGESSEETTDVENTAEGNTVSTDNQTDANVQNTDNTADATTQASDNTADTNTQNTETGNNVEAQTDATTQTQETAQ